MSLSASGSLGKGFSYSNMRGRAYARGRRPLLSRWSRLKEPIGSFNGVVSFGDSTFGQIATLQKQKRQNFSFGPDYWKNLTELQQMEYTKRAKNIHSTGFSLFMREYLKP